MRPRFFAPSRDDGRSDRQVIYEAIRDAVPGQVFDYATLAAALQVGVSEPITQERVGSAARAANRLLLREKQRAIEVVKGVGYRVAAAEEHLGLAVSRRHRAETNIRRGIELLRNCRTEELSDVQRNLHEGQFLIMSGVYQAVRYANSRIDRHQKVLQVLTERVERLEENGQ